MTFLHLNLTALGQLTLCLSTQRTLYITKYPYATRLDTCQYSISPVPDFMMSRTPYCPNSLSPWPRIYFRDVEAEVSNDPIDNVAGGAQSAGQMSVSEGSRKRRLTDVGPILKAFTRDKQPEPGFEQVVLDGMLTQAKHEGVQREGILSKVSRLRPLELVDKAAENETGKGNQQTEDSSSCTDIVDLPVVPPRAVKQGHTAALCQHMKRQRLYGILIPTEFISCVVHPTPEASETLLETRVSSSTLGSQSSETPSTRSASTRSRNSTLGSSTPCESYSSQSGSPTCDCSPKNRQPENHSPSTPEILKEDPFLYIGKYIHQHKRATRFPTPHNLRRNINQSCSPQCVCANHACRSYLSGKQSKHCRECCLPRPQPEIRRAISRLKSIQMSAASSSVKKSTVSSLQADLMLVEAYNAEIEKRSENGVWWEGWLIVEDLKVEGVVGSHSQTSGKTGTYRSL